MTKEEDLNNAEQLERNNELIVQIQSFEEIMGEIAKTNSTALGEDEIRLRYIREAGDWIRQSVYKPVNN